MVLWFSLSNFLAYQKKHFYLQRNKTQSNWLSVKQVHWMCDDPAVHAPPLHRVQRLPQGQGHADPRVLRPLPAGSPNPCEHPLFRMDVGGEVPHQSGRLHTGDVRQPGQHPGKADLP